MPGSTPYRVRLDFGQGHGVVAASKGAGGKVGTIAAHPGANLHPAHLRPAATMMQPGRAGGGSPALDHAIAVRHVVRREHSDARIAARAHPGLRANRAAEGVGKKPRNGMAWRAPALAQCYKHPSGAHMEHAQQSNYLCQPQGLRPAAPPRTLRCGSAGPWPAAAQSGRSASRAPPRPAARGPGTSRPQSCAAAGGRRAA